MDSKKEEILQSLKPRMRPGDLKLLAQVRNFSYSYVTKVFSRSTTHFNQDLYDTAEQICAQREEFASQLV